MWINIYFVWYNNWRYIRTFILARTGVRMKNKYLYWIIPICILLGLLIGYILGFEHSYDVFMKVIRCGK